MRETRYGVCSERNERQSLSERDLRIKNCVELELRFKNCVERIPGFPCIILSPFVFHSSLSLFLPQTAKREPLMLRGQEKFKLSGVSFCHPEREATKF